MNRHEQDVMERALQIQQSAERDQEQKEREGALKAAATEVGLDPRSIDQARKELALEQVRAAAARKQRRRNWTLGILGAVSLGLAGIGVSLVMTPADPVSETFSGGSARWNLDANVGTLASLKWTHDPIQGEAAQIGVEGFALDSKGKYWVNLDSPASFDLSGHSRVAFSVRGTGLKNVRLYLEKAEERWRSPPVPVTGDWTRHELSLSSFERQKKEGEWKVVDWKPPGEVANLSFKVGHFINEQAATGEVTLDDLQLD